MKTSLTTFEDDLRLCLLDTVYGQWSRLGVPYVQSLSTHSREIIDPEALVWFSLEFCPREPRLAEGLVEWVLEFDQYLIRQRINKLADKNDPRFVIWSILDTQRRPRSNRPTQNADEPQVSEDLRAYCEWFTRWIDDRDHTNKRVGRPVHDATTVLLQARDVLGSDIRHFILIYLLTHHGRGKLKTISQWSTYSYRSVSETATRWESADIVTIDHGTCTLTQTDAWHALLQHHIRDAVWVDWPSVFSSCIELLRALRKADGKSLTLDSPVLRKYCRAVIDATSSLGGDRPEDAAPSIREIRDVVLAAAPSALDHR